MQKEYEKQQTLEHMSEQDRIKYQQTLEEQQKKHQKHEKIHNPGNKAQLEEVWEDQDHMDPEDFDPKKFFQLHGMYYIPYYVCVSSHPI